MTDYERIVYCMKLWIKELKEDKPEDLDKEQEKARDWIVATWENEIHDGTYCEDEEYNEYLITGKI